MAKKKAPKRPRTTSIKKKWYEKHEEWQFLGLILIITTTTYLSLSSKLFIVVNAVLILFTLTYIWVYGHRKIREKFHPLQKYDLADKKFVYDFPMNAHKVAYILEGMMKEWKVEYERKDYPNKIDFLTYTPKIAWVLRKKPKKTSMAVYAKKKYENYLKNVAAFIAIADKEVKEKLVKDKT